MTPLHMASLYGYANCVKLLLEYGKLIVAYAQICFVKKWKLT